MSSKIFICAVSAAFFAAPLSASAATQIYYSVGQNTNNHAASTSPLTVTISGTTATFSEPQTATNMGVGDVINYGGSSAFITKKTSTSVWLVETATGTTPVATTSAVVSSITHAFSSLNAAIGTGIPNNATSTNFLNTSNLTAGSFNLNIPLYYDTGPDTAAVVLAGLTTGSGTGLYIYTPTSTASQVNQSQRHHGVWNDQAYSLVVGDVEVGILVSIPNTWIDGIQLDHTILSLVSPNSILVKERDASSDVRISNSIVRVDFSALQGTMMSGNAIIDLTSNSSIRKIWNNILYMAKPCGCANGIYGIYLWQTKNGYVYSNTIAGFDQPFGSFSSTYVVKDNLAFASSTWSAFEGAVPAGSDYNATNLSGQAGDLGPHGRILQTFTFISTSTYDYHLAGSDAGARDFGVSLASDSILAFNTDIDGEARPQGSAWDIGADEYHDTWPPVVSAVASTTDATSTTITWTTDEVSDSMANIGLTTTNAFASSTFSSSAVTSHSIYVGGLHPCTTYYFKVRSSDPLGNTVLATPKTLVTAGCTGNSTVLSSASSLVGSGGGTLSLVESGDGLTLTVPASFASTTSSAYFQIQRLDQTAVAASAGAPAGKLAAADLTYHLSSLPTATTSLSSFDSGLSVTMAYDHTLISGLDETSLKIYRYDGSAWHELSGCVVDPDANTVTCTTTQFSDFGLFGDPPAVPSVVPATVAAAPSIHPGGWAVPPPAKAHAPGSVLITRTLLYGSSGPAVLALQQRLNSLGFTLAVGGPGSPGKETSYFGPLTRKAVRAFQLYYQIAKPGDAGFGIAGPRTRAQLNKL